MRRGVARVTVSRWTAVGVLLAGCAGAMQSSPAHDLAWERWRACRARYPSAWLDYITNDGVIQFNAPSGGVLGGLNECLAEEAARQTAAAQPKGPALHEPSLASPPPPAAPPTPTAVASVPLAFLLRVQDSGTDGTRGNGDGRIQLGERVTLHVEIKNNGTTPISKTLVEIAQREHAAGLAVREGRGEIGPLGPQETRTVRATLVIDREFASDEILLRLAARDGQGRTILTEDLRLGVDRQPAQPVRPLDARMEIGQASVSIRSGAGVETAVIAAGRAGEELTVTGELGDWYRVRISESETGWVAKREVGEVRSPAASPSAPVATAVAPTAPVVSTAPPPTETAPVVPGPPTPKASESEVDTAPPSPSPAAPPPAVTERVPAGPGPTAPKAAEAPAPSPPGPSPPASPPSAAPPAVAAVPPAGAERALPTPSATATAPPGPSPAAAPSPAPPAPPPPPAASPTPSIVRIFQNAPPVIALASPSEGQQVSGDRVPVAGAAASGRGIARLEIRVNGRLVAQREGRGVAVVPAGQHVAENVDFSERVVLVEGRNEIMVTAVDRDNLTTSRTITLTRVVDRGRIWAVVVGISRYRAIQSLRYADRDAVAFAEYLRANVGVPAESVTLLTNEQATLQALKRVLGTELRRRAGEKDTVIIYYAGHGAPESDAGSPDGDGLEKYIVPHDGDPKDLYTTGLPMREIETIFGRLNSERVIFITDSCYSGATAGRTFATAARRAVVSDAFLARLSRAKGRVVLTASRASEVSEEREDLRHGVFTYYLLEGLRGKADVDGDGIVTVDEAYAYVSSRVPDATGQNQHPVKKGEVEGQLVLGRVR
jgi:hypothetical protein